MRNIDGDIDSVEINLLAQMDFACFRSIFCVHFMENAIFLLSLTAIPVFASLGYSRKIFFPQKICLLYLRSFTSPSNRTTVQIIFRKGIKTSSGPSKGKGDRLWQNSDPRPSSWTRTTLTSWSASLDKLHEVNVSNLHTS